MKIRLFKHEKVVPTIGIIKYRRFTKVFKEIITKYSDQEAYQRIRDLMVKYNFDFTELEVPNENSYYFIITGLWYKSGTFN